MASHHVAPELVAPGHEVKQVPPAYSKSFRQGHKNDFWDAHAVAEAAERPSTRCVPIKTDGQLDLEAPFQIRSAIVQHRRHGGVSGGGKAIAEAALKTGRSARPR
jgi:transposase